MAANLLDISKAKPGSPGATYYAQCKRCFMTGKACIYQREIAQHFKNLDSGVAGANPLGQAFMLMPFRSILDEVYRAQLEPCLLSVVARSAHGDDLERIGWRTLLRTLLAEEFQLCHRPLILGFHSFRFCLNPSPIPTHADARTDPLGLGKRGEG